MSYQRRRRFSLYWGFILGFLKDPQFSSVARVKVPDEKVFPHDALVRRVFGVAEHAAQELRVALPSPLLQHLDLASLTVEGSGFVSRQLRATTADMLYGATYRGRPAFLYILFEHMSTVDELMPLRMLGGVVQVLERHVRSRQAQALPVLPLPLVIPLVLHHSASGWTGETRFELLFDLDATADPAVLGLIPRFGFLLDDISHVSDGELRARRAGALVTLTLALLRDGRSGRLVRTVTNFLPEITAVFQGAGGQDAFETLMVYLFHVASDHEAESVASTIGTAIPGSKEAVMTFAEKLRLEGEARGKAEAEKSILLRLLTRKFETVSPEALSRIDAAAEADHMRWVDRVLTANSVAEVLSD